MNVSEVWSDFPTANVEADTQRMNDELAQAIKDSPDQYYWVHKRFKTRPEGEPSVYKKAEISR
jgi:KDO2-lipid IV(A) lauroyltransferase